MPYGGRRHPIALCGTIHVPQTGARGFVGRPHLGWGSALQLGLWTRLVTALGNFDEYL
jgi:hypothetical protein